MEGAAKVQMTGKKTKITAALTALIIMLVILCSSIFIIEHIDHECTGRDCTVCREIAQFRSNLSMSGTTADPVVIAAAFIFVMAELIALAVRTSSGRSTLITLKVELLN